MARKSRKNLPGTQPRQGVKVWRAALYIRLSVEQRNERGESLETQRQIMETHLAAYPDIEIADVYTDNGVTGQRFDREAFERMLADIEAGRIDCVVVKDLSRLGRDTISTGYYLEKYFPLHHVRFIAVNDRYDSEDPDSEGNHLIVPLKNMINEAYCADLSRKIRAQARQAMKDGAFIGSRPPYGYRKDPENCHKLLVNEDTAPVVRQIFEWIADGVPLNAVVKRLNARGIPTPGYYMAGAGLVTNPKLMGSGSWQTRTLNVILSDEVYMGDMVQGKTVSVRHKQYPAKREDWIVVRDTHEPIVSRELFAKVQQVRARTAARAKQAGVVPFTPNLLRGCVFCGCCGRSLHRMKSHGVYLYRCIANDRIRDGICEGVNVTEEQLFGVIREIIRKQTETLAGNETRIRRNDDKLAARKTDTERELAELARKMENSRKYLTSLYESLVTGVLTQAEYLEMKQSYAREIDEAAARSQELRERQAELTEQAERYIRLADYVAGLDADSELTQQLIDLLIERVTVNARDDVSIQFTFESGFDRLWEAVADG